MSLSSLLGEATQWEPKGGGDDTPQAAHVCPVIRGRHGTET